MAETLRQEKGPLSDVNGWGVDLENRPGIPRERHSNVLSAYGPPLPQQKPTMKIHVSVEHRGLSPVFGESAGPKAISGLLRDYAYRFGEGRNARWMTLILADRVDVIEERFRDLLRGTLPNPFKEGGWKADLKHNRLALVGRGASYAAVAVAAAMLIRRVLKQKKMLNLKS